MEAKSKTGARGMKGKVTTAYSKYIKSQTNNTTVSIAQPYQYQVTAPSSVEAVAAVASYAAVDDIDERATAFILAVRERIRNEHMM
ncbi:hypothetical protein PR202_ga08462 [Eleusine coracana subsp. coracana]|uniref:Uncharacterized protein n=1 Tax=Eleusine coracana subsp. coracana TaxID=191504 RepID=A0AAV5C2B3_ELECO|nr:hypothetical protein PR202_ga08462 [Eleusine coracana subsp. coracana]